MFLIKTELVCICLLMYYWWYIVQLCMFFNKDFPTPSDNCESVEWILSCHELGYQMSIFFKTLYQFKAFNLFFIMEFTSWKYLIPFKSYTYIINVLKNTIYKCQKWENTRKKRALKFTYRMNVKTLTTFCSCWSQSEVELILAVHAGLGQGISKILRKCCWFPTMLVPEEYIYWFPAYNRQEHLSRPKSEYVPFTNLAFQKIIII